MVTNAYSYDDLRATKKEDGTFLLGTEAEVTYEKGSKFNATGAEGLMCKKQHTKPLREFLAKAGDKWRILLVVMLASAPCHRARFSELQKMVEGISQRMLTTALRQLGRDGSSPRTAARIPAPS